MGWSGIPSLAGRSIVGLMALGITELFGLSRGPFPPSSSRTQSPIERSFVSVACSSAAPSR